MTHPQCPVCGGEVQFTDLAYGRLRSWGGWEVSDSEIQAWYCENDHYLIVDDPDTPSEIKAIAHEGYADPADWRPDAS